MNSGGAVCACAQFNRGDQVDQLAEAGSLGWMLGWSVALLRVSTPGSPTFLSHHRRRPAALFRSFHHPFDREVDPPPSVDRLYPTRTLPTVCFRSLFHSVSVSPSAPRALRRVPFLSPFSLPPRVSSSSSSSSQRHQLSSTPPATPNCSRVSNRGASRLTLQVADRFAATESDCFGPRRAVTNFEPEASSVRRTRKIIYAKGIEF